MSSQDMIITHKAIQDRAESDAREHMPELPTKNTVEAWESFQQAVEDLDAMDIAHESSEWDWVIYYHRALELCQAVPSAVLHEAESEFEGMGGTECMPSVGLYEIAVQLAALIVEREIVEAVERIKDELIGLAENQMENM